MFDESGDPTIKFWVSLVGGFVGLIVLWSVFPFTIVSVGERTIVLRNGAINRTLAEGIHFITPVIESTINLDVTTKLESVSAQAASKDLQNVTAQIGVNYQLNADQVAEIYTQYRGDVETRVIAPAVQEAVKAATARYTAEELITKREAVRADIIANLKEKVSSAHITVTNVSITNLEFSAQFNQAVESKVKAEQDALTQKNLLEKVKYEAEQKIATAQAEAESIRLQSQAASNEKYVSLKQLEVQKAFADKWNGVSCQSNCWGSAQGPMPVIQLGK